MRLKQTHANLVGVPGLIVMAIALVLADVALFRVCWEYSHAAVAFPLFLTGLAFVLVAAGIEDIVKKQRRGL